MSRNVITAKNAPAAAGAYSHAIVANGFVFCSGQVGFDPETGELVEGGIVAQTEQALKNIKAVLEAAGSSMKSVVKTTVFIRHVEHFAEMNRAYRQAFSDEPPARSTVPGVDLPVDALVEIEAIAVLEA